MAEPENPAAGEAGLPAQDASDPQARPQIEIDDSQVQCGYANFCRVTGTPEELIIDFGLNPQYGGPAPEPIPVTQRIITNLFTAKRLAHLLAQAVRRHEAAFGALEIDVQKRVERRNA
jgi:hypothetical protein